MRVSPAELDAPFGARDEEGAANLEDVETLEVQVGAIDHIERTGLRRDVIEDVDVVPFSFGNLNECGDRTAQVKEGVHLDRGLGGPEASPWEHRQTEVDSRGIQGIHRVVEIEAERLVGVHGAGQADEHLSEVGVDAPVVRLVGVGQRRSRNLAAKAHVIEFVLHRTQAGFDVAETLAVGQLCEGHTQELIEAGKPAEFVIPPVPRHALLELVGREVIHQLGEDDAADVHAPLSDPTWGKPRGDQNRHRKFKSKNPRRPLSLLTPLELSPGSEAIAGRQ